MTEITVHHGLEVGSVMASRMARRAALVVRHAVEPVRRRAQRFVASEHASRSEVIASVFAAFVYWVGIVVSMLGTAASRVWRARHRGHSELD